MSDPDGARRADRSVTARWDRIDSIALAAVTFVGGLLRLVRLSDPSKLVFDETYYAKDACWYVEVSSQLCKTDVEQTQVHPPLAKWLIAEGIRLFGYNSLGWRFVSAVAGTITIALLYLLARKLLRSTLAATIAAGLLAFDFLHFVQSRIAMLDVFVAFFAVAAFLFVVYDRDRLIRRDPPLSGRRGLLQRRWRYAAGVAAGWATASKWSGATVVVAVFVLGIAWEIAARRADGEGDVLRRFFREEAPSLVLAFVVVPLVSYVVTFIGRVDGPFFSLPWSEGSWLRNLWDRHLYMVDFHANLEATHPYQSPPWSWLLLKRPVSYFYCSGSECRPPVAAGQVEEILATGSPFVWWSSILALVYVALRWVRRRDFAGAEGVILAGFAFGYGVWLLPFGRPAVFLFYMVAVVPFMCLAVSYVLLVIGESWEARAATAIFSAATIALFAYYYPVLAKVPLSTDAWRDRIWIFDDCDKPPGEEKTTTVTTTQGTRTKTKATVTNTADDIPPKGWCWI